MSDHREMMKRKFHSNNVEVMEGIKVKEGITDKENVKALRSKDIDIQK